MKYTNKIKDIEKSENIKDLELELESAAFISANGDADAGAVVWAIKQRLVELRVKGKSKKPKEPEPA